MKRQSLFIGGLILSICFYFLPKRESPEILRFKDGTKIEIKLIEARVIDKNGIGDEWSFSSKASNSITIDEVGTLVDVGSRTKIDIISTAIESDPSSDDIGEGRIQIRPDNISDFFAESIVEDIVSVYERYGKGAGNTAICRFKYSIKVDTSNLIDSKSK